MSTPAGFLLGIVKAAAKRWTMRCRRISHRWLRGAR